jgi:glucose/arabinose dehydrogenase
MPSFVDLPAHSTAIGINAYNDNLYVALHGSYQQKPPSGYTVVKVNPQTAIVSEFVSGFIDSQGKVFGRPTDIVNYQNGMLISDDMMGKIYFVYPK